MGPKRHYRVFRGVQVASVLLALPVACAVVTRFAEELQVVPCAGLVCTGMAVAVLVVLLGTLPKWVVPARCPACGRFRCWVFTEMSEAGQGWKYHCWRCGHERDTGVVWTHPDEAW